MYSACLHIRLTRPEQIMGYWIYVSDMFYQGPWWISWNTLSHITKYIRPMTWYISGINLWMIPTSLSTKNAEYRAFCALRGPCLGATWTFPFGSSATVSACLGLTRESLPGALPEHSGERCKRRNGSKCQDVSMHVRLILPLQNTSMLLFRRVAERALAVSLFVFAFKRATPRVS